jgi:ubiquinone/menaquinone biosynthesis C-methylase UbiE
VDISEKQIERAARHLKAYGLSAKLIYSPMEEEYGLPVDYFDFVYSIYTIGWTTDFEGTFGWIASCLQKGGVLIT